MSNTDVLFNSFIVVGYYLAIIVAFRGLNLPYSTVPILSFASESNTSNGQQLAPSSCPQSFMVALCRVT